MQLAMLAVCVCALAADGGARGSMALFAAPSPSGPVAAGVAYAIVDLPSQRTLAEQHGDWLDAPAWPGSIAKLAVYAAAIDAGILDSSTRIQCTRQVTLRDGRRVDCSHPVLRTPLSLRDAIALSCNVFGAEVARRLTATQLSAGFVRLGLPVPHLGDDTDRVAIALGLAGTQIPPRQLLSALVRASRIDALREGLQASAREGTASGLGRAGIDAFAKTGTALMRNRRPLGLVVAIAPASSPRLGIIVAVPGGAGADAADIAASLLQPRLASSAAAPAAQEAPAASAAAATAAGEMIRVGVPRANGGYRVETLPLEEYVARVVAGETSSATPTAAREALAITARTYALANRGRHAAGGFDLCTLTHCQVLRPASSASREAAMRTRAQILARETDASDKPVPVFYSAACGGRLDDASVLLPDTPAGSLSWMTKRDDPAGVEEPAWQAELSAVDLLKALHAAGVRGDALRDLEVQTNAGGRVTAITLAGLTPSTLAADDFRRIIGQHLGWQWLKSLRFTAQRTARGYRFTGRGHGHGVGLCMLGASALATRGQSAADLLRAYFPGLHVRLAPAAPATVPKGHPPSLAASEAASANRAASHAASTLIDVRLPAAQEAERASLKSQLARDLRALAATLDGASSPARLSLIVHPTVDSFHRATGRPWWASAATMFADTDSHATIHVVPLEGLRRSGRLDSILRHEVVHVVTAPQLRGKPMWVHEGIAAYFSAERPAALAASPPTPLVCPTDADFARAKTSADFQKAYARAWSCVADQVSHGTRWDAIR